MSDGQVARLARGVSIAFMAAALILALTNSKTIVGLLLLGYDGVTQFFPGVMLGLFWRRASVLGVFSGLVTGIATVVVLILTRHDPFLGLNAGFVGLALNFLVTISLCLIGSGQPNAKSTAIQA